uniref:Uncharacterized protein n=1 Tax=uncultured marine microorganism HF4000_009L19 TaxID=455516 RepID=B3T1H6_9ZZZZ|nr:hypothetical protein ALOHA_HF4000009L19ctg2g10 [uncultured marine microorganism HF4000_009L19]
MPRQVRWSRPYLEGTGSVPRWCAGCALAAELDDVLCGRALQPLDHVELHPLTLGEALEALALKRRVVHKNVLLPVVASQEPEPLAIVEPLDCSLVCHLLPTC